MPLNKYVKNCGAKSKQNYLKPCTQPAMRNKKRCRLHGGKSTGPRTTEGKIKSAQANYKHGYYSKDMISEKREMKLLLNWLKYCDTTN